MTPPVGLGYLAAYSAQALKDMDIELIDCNLKQYDVPKIQELVKEKDPLIVGITIYTSFYNKALDVIKGVKIISPGTRIVVGGPHPSALPRLVLENKEIDFVITGEGEETFVELVKNIERPENYSSIKGLAYKDGDGIKINPPRPFMEDLDRLPFPSWDFIPPDKYTKMPHGSLARRYPVAPIVSSRGCPFDCSFCGSESVWKRKWRARSPKNIVDEIEMLRDRYGVNEIHFEDDNFTLDRKRAIGVCEEIIKRGLDISWSCPNGVRVDNIDRELLRLMKRSGCYSLVFGIESGHKKILEKVNKRISLDAIERAVRMTVEEGIKATGFFIIGLPGETRESILSTITFSKKLPLDRAQFGLFAPLPGSRDYELWLEKERPDEIDWDRFNFYNVIFKLDDLSEDDIKSFQKKAFREFYFRPRVVFNILKDMHFKEMVPVFKRFKDIFVK